ncbi:MAG: hypothetical protein IKZ44_06850 [Clostridia bacterium]|nr:hypothetical protein [Clostridia bacterium]
MAVTVEELQILLSCDAAQAEAVLDAITKKVDGAVKKMQGKLDGAMDGGGTGGSKKQTSYYDALVKKISTAREKMNEALSGMQAGTEGADVNYNHWSQQVDSLTKRLEKLRDTQKDVNETAAEMRDIPIQYPQQGKGGYQPWSRPVENWQASRERSRDAMRYIESDQRQASRVDTEKLAYGTPYEKLHEQFVRASEKVDELAAKLRQLQEEGGSPKAIDALESKLETASNKADRLAEKMAKIEDKATGGNGAGEDIKQTGDAAQEATPKIESYNRALGKTSKAQGLFSRIGKASHKMFDKFGHSFKKHDGLLSQFGKTLKRVIMRMLAMALIRGTLRAISEGMTLLGKASNEAQKQLNRFKAMGNSVKTAFGSAALAALTALAPVLYQIASAAIYAANAIARFFAVLGGGSYFAVNMADNFDDIGEAAGGAGGKVKGLLADFDELNVIGQQGGGGGGGGSLGGTTVTEETPQSILAELLNSGLFFEAGQYISDGLGSISEKITAWFEELAQKDYGTKFAQFLNGIFSKPENFEKAGIAVATGINTIADIIFNFFDTFDAAKAAEAFSRKLNAIVDNIKWSRIGEAFGTGVSDIFEFIYTFLTTFDAEKAGKNLASCLNGIANSINWKTVGGTFSAGVNDVFDIVYGFFTEFDWKGLARDLGDLLNSGFGDIEWGKIGVTISEAALDLIDFVSEFLLTFDWGGILVALVDLVEGILVGLLSDPTRLLQALDHLIIGIVRAVGDLVISAIAWLADSIFGPAEDLLFGGRQERWTSEWDALMDSWVGSVDQAADEIRGDIGITADATETALNRSSSAIEGGRKSLEKYAKSFDKIPSSKTTNIKVNVTTTSSGSGGGSGSGTTVRPTVNVNMAMASGGLAYGETLARIGEYPNARSNPEVVAPLDKLQGILERSGGGSNSKDVREQNALLREQNRLLQIIAKKKLEVSPTPELGQVVTRAQALYGEV